MTTVSVRQHLPPIVDPERHYSIEEYLAIEEATGERFEYQGGRLLSVRAMAGDSGYHALLAGNLILALGVAVRA